MYRVRFAKFVVRSTRESCMVIGGGKTTIQDHQREGHVTWGVVLDWAKTSRARTTNRANAERAGDDRGKRYNRRYLDGAPVTAPLQRGGGERISHDVDRAPFPRLPPPSTPPRRVVWISPGEGPRDVDTTRTGPHDGHATKKTYAQNTRRRFLGRFSR